MIAHVGDRLQADQDSGRAGIIIELHRADGSPPYVVRWLDTGHIALVFPGTFARIAPAHRASASAVPGPRS